MTALNRLIVILIALGIVSSGVIALQRMGYEAVSNNVLLAVDLPSEEASVFDQLPLSGQAVVMTPAELIDSHPSADQLVVLELDAWVPLETFPNLLVELTEQPIDGVYVDLPLSASREHLHFIGDYFEDQNVFIAFNEFADRDPLSDSLAHAHLPLVRAHKVDQFEWGYLSSHDKSQRIVRAVRERKTELVVVSPAETDNLQSEINIIESELVSAGFSLGLPVAGTDFAVSPVLELLMLMGLLALITWILLSQIAMSSQTAWAILIALNAIGIMLYVNYEHVAQLGVAWLAAVAVPVGAFILMRDRFSAQFSIRGSFIWVGALSLGSIGGGLLAAGFLSESGFFLGIEIFRGVKAALIAPIAVVVVLTVREMMRNGFGVLDGVVILVVGLILAAMLLRSGNASGIAVASPSGLEHNLRAILEDFLYARPRFKEFLIGHPALILWGSLAAMKWRSWGWGLLLIGLIGQVSIVNSFLHLHTPLELTLLRVFNGLWLGVLVGLLAIGGYHLLQVALGKLKLKGLPG